jgi:ABC-type multidrug transport system permease subunit
MQTPVFLLLFLASVYVPRDLLHGWIKGVSGLNPFTALIEAGRGFISGGQPSILLAFGVAAGMIALFTLWSLTGLHRAESST